jgi:hypothetical protein
MVNMPIRLAKFYASFKELRQITSGKGQLEMKRYTGAESIERTVTGESVDAKRSFLA